MRGRVCRALALCAFLAKITTVRAEERFGAHAQSTFVVQYHPPFHAPYAGPMSLESGNRSDETWSASLFAGARFWRGAELYVNPELLQGFGLSNSTGIAAFPNAEAFKVGTKAPVFKLSRLFFRQTFALGATTEALESDQNQLAGERALERVTLTFGKFSVVDVFDDNAYAHDSRSGFLNWTINELGAFDMASPAYNYTYGVAAEWYQAWFALRAGFFLEPTYPNSEEIDVKFRQFQPVGEFEERHRLWGRPGKLRLLLFGKYVEAGSFADALAAARTRGEVPSTALVRHGRVWGYGGGLNLEQELADGLGLFARVSEQAGDREEFAFTQVQASASGGLVLSGGAWSRASDTVGLGLVVDGVFKQEQAYLANGGSGIIIGDGALRYGAESVVEAYYAFVPWRFLALTLDYQFVNHPAFNRERGPVSVFGLRFHLEI